MSHTGIWKQIAPKDLNAECNTKTWPVKAFTLIGMDLYGSRNMALCNTEIVHNSVTGIRKIREDRESILCVPNQRICGDNMYQSKQILFEFRQSEYVVMNFAASGNKCHK